jgi:ketosteroid isomerase-like protein
MTRKNVEVVRAALDAWNRGDWEAVLKDAAPNFEFDFSRSVGPGRGVYSLDQMTQYFQEFTEAWESLNLEAHELIDAGQHLVMVTTLEARGRGGIELHAQAAFVWTIRDGRATHLSFYQERKEALEAVGLAGARRSHLTPGRHET